MSDVQVLAEQIRRLGDQVSARLERQEATLQHAEAMNAERFKALWGAIEQIRTIKEDHETRLRKVDDEVIALRALGSVVQAGQALLTLLASAIAAWLGGR